MGLQSSSELFTISVNGVLYLQVQGQARAWGAPPGCGRGVPGREGCRYVLSSGHSTLTPGLGEVWGRTTALRLVQAELGHGQASFPKRHSASGSRVLSSPH